MKARCYNKKHKHYNNYGGRGIIVCEEWKNNFIKFKDDMYDSYKEHCEVYGEYNTSIDRIDVDYNYNKENCKWATNKEQQNNLRNNVKIVIDNKEYTVYEAAEEFNIPHGTIRSRITKGVTGIDLVKPKDTPVAERISGVKGVIWNKKMNKWIVKGVRDGIEDKYIKSFHELDEALIFKSKWDRGEITEENLKVRENNTSGVIGVRKMKNGKWKATIQIDKKPYIKTFENKEDAIQWRNNIEKNKR